ncbi:lipoprotein LipO [Clostridia bacterium]|nr:lipoprotein LipO [Clostridia bacterium]
MKRSQYARSLAALIALALLLSAMPAVVQADDRPTISIFLQMQSEFNPEDSPFLEQIQQATGVDIQLIMPPINSYAESLNLMIADGSYPDIIQMPSVTSAAYINSVDSGILLPLDGLIGQYANLTQYIDPSSYAALRASANGTLYGIARNTIDRLDGFIVRQDWLDNVGLSIPDSGIVTLDEFYDILYAFTYDDPDGNGINDTYGLIDRTPGGNLYPFIPYAFGCQGWQAHETTYAYMNEAQCLEHDNYKQVLAYTAKLWKDGLIDPVWPSSPGDEYRDRFYTGAAGLAYFFGGWIGTFENALKANYPDATVAYIAGVSGADGECIAGSSFPGNIYSFYSLSISCAGKEDAAIRILDYLLSDEGWDLMNYGVKGTHWDEDENGGKYALDAFGDYSKYRSFLTLLRRYDDPAYFVGLNLSPEQRAFATDAISKAMRLVKPDLSYGYAPAAAQETRLLEYNSELSIVRSKIIVGELPIDAWDDALTKWYDAGGRQVVEDMNTFIAANQQ